MNAIAVSVLKGKRPAYAKDGYYREPRRLVDKILDRETFTGSVLDPACGGGTIVSTCLDRGLDAIGSDIRDRGFPGAKVQDFFSITTTVDNIFSNPNFEHAEAFARHALAITQHKVVLLLRFAFFESICREQFFNDFPISRIWFPARRPSIPPGLADGPRDHNGALKVPQATGGSMLYGIFVWDLLEPVPFTRIDRL